MATTIKASARDSGGVDGLEALCLEMRNFLGGVKQSINDEIHAYPTPIPRCDAQFNFLYEQRSRLARILARADAMSNHGDVPRELVDTLAEFAASAPFTEGVKERTLRERISAELSRLSPPFDSPASVLRVDR